MEIKVYSIPTCTWCVKLKDWLKANKVSFQDFDLTESDSARDEIINKSGQMATPVTIISHYEDIEETDKEEKEEPVLIKETVIVGFDEKELTKALKE
jgi:glutaredoxin 3